LQLLVFFTIIKHKISYFCSLFLIKMNLKKSVFLFLILAFVSCHEQTKVNLKDVVNAQKQKEKTFKALQNAWLFEARELSPEAEILTNSWEVWRDFLVELNEKPRGTISAFQQKAKILIQKSETLEPSIPEKLNKTQIKVRLTVIITKLKSFSTFVNLDLIPEKKVIGIIQDLYIEINAFLDQVEEIATRSQIKLEEGEAEMLNKIKPNSKPTILIKPTN
jgi:hypothetical protein